MPVIVNDNSFQKEVLEAKLPVLVDFWAEWCGPCRMLTPVIEGVAKKYEGKLKVCKLNTDESPASAQEYNITGIPCCLVFKDGKEIARLVGFRPQAAFETELDKHL